MTKISFKKQITQADMVRMKCAAKVNNLVSTVSLPMKRIVIFINLISKTFNFKKLIKEKLYF